MEQHVIATELSATGAQELLAATSSAHLAYAEDGNAACDSGRLLLDRHGVRDFDCNDVAERSPR